MHNFMSLQISIISYHLLEAPIIPKGEIVLQSDELIYQFDISTIILHKAHS